MVRRKRRFSRIAIVAVVLVIVIWVIVNAGDQGGAPESVSVRQGKTFQLQLEGNPTTGYIWEIAKLDERMLELVGEPEFASDSNAIGSGGEFTFTFKALSQGDTTVELVYHRPWEKGVEPLETHSCLVSIN